MTGSSAEKSPGETFKSCVYETRIYISSQLSVQKSTVVLKNFLEFFGIELLATQTNSKSGENVSKMIESESLKSLPACRRLLFSFDVCTQAIEKSEDFAVKTDIQLEKDCKLSNLHKLPSVFNIFFFSF